ncbi:MAG: hypothetical protein COV67_10150 [Nitrospinae bacterium CG11_big_fil_rev_8_21_14_0_20_56_8]|nr:MAG: hypothetical protein COV67_10150 [Nitrospinae bacterium CG11_big_fil_rev_8_21_14_0_20_56_8]
MDFLYNILISVLGLVATPFLLLKSFMDPAFRGEWIDRLKGGDKVPLQPNCVWVHAASVGEIRVAKILIAALRVGESSRKIVLSAFTRTGYFLAKQESSVPVFRLPPDLPFLVRPLMIRLQPALLVLIEAELWPCLLRQCLHRNIPVVLVNGRMTEKAFGNYARVGWFFRWMTEGITVFSMRSEADAKRILDLGISPKRVRVTGNIKFDLLTASADPDRASEAPSVGNPIAVFGSTRPGDEGPVMEAILKLKEEFPDLSFIIAPRHIERCQEVDQLVRSFGMEPLLHSRNPDRVPRPGEILLLDRLGLLNHYYARAVVAFVGGGFNPRFGGQNILEPAALGVPVVFGPHMNNFEEEARLLSQSGGGVQLKNTAGLYPALRQLVADPEERNRRSEAARQTVAQNRGAVEKNVQFIESQLPKPSREPNPQ